METSSHRLSATFLGFLSLWRVKSGTEKSQPSNHGLVFLVTSPHPEAHQESSHLKKDVPLTQEIPRDLRTLC